MPNVEPSQSFRLKFIADPEFVEKLKDEARRNPDELELDPEREEKDATQLGFDLHTVLSVVATIRAALYTKDLATRIYQYWTDGKSKKVIIQSPFGTLEFRKTSPVTEEDVRKFLEAAQGLHK
jgi:hypothetical protein